MRQKFTNILFTAIRNVNYKYMYNDRYSHFVTIPTLRRSNSGIVLRKVRIPTSTCKVRILTLRKTIPDLCGFLFCAEHVYHGRTKSEGCGYVKNNAMPLLLFTISVNVFAYLFLFIYLPFFFFFFFFLLSACSVFIVVPLL